MLASLGSKLAILGPPRIVAEVPETLAPACGLFSANGYVQEALLTDYVAKGLAPSERGDAARVEGLVIPITVDDLVANDLLGQGPPSPSASAGQADRRICWERSVETLMARKDDIAGLAVASDERIEAYLLYVEREMEAMEIVSLRSFIDDGGARLKQLLCQVRARGIKSLWFPKVHPAEIPKEWVEALGFRPAGAHLLYAARAQSA